MVPDGYFLCKLKNSNLSGVLLPPSRSAYNIYYYVVCWLHYILVFNQFVCIWLLFYWFNAYVWIKFIILFSLFYLIRICYRIGVSSIILFLIKCRWNYYTCNIIIAIINLPQPNTRREIMTVFDVTSSVRYFVN